MTDTSALLALYNRAVPAAYRVTDEAFQGLTDGAQLLPHFTDGVLTGYALLRASSLTLLVVDPEHQGRGIGTSLLHRAEQCAKSGQASRLILGHGSDYVIQGVPAEAGAHRFFETHGFVHTGFTYDMSLDLDGLDRMPPFPDGIEFRISAPDAALLDAVKAVEKSWCAVYESTDEDVLCAMDGEAIAGFCIPAAWNRFFGGRREVGSISCVGVLPEYRRRGIGLAMTASAARYLRDEGCTCAELLYTSIPQWYAKIGFTPIHRLWMGEKRI